MPAPKPPHPDFNEASRASASPESKTMALVIDLGVGNMEREDARHFLDALGETLTDLRAREIPITWLAMRKDTQLYRPEPTSAGTNPAARDLEQIYDMGFRMSPGDRNADLFTDFLAKHGPRTDEAVACKAFKSALLEKSDLDGRPEEYRTHLQEEVAAQDDPQRFRKELDDLCLTDYLRERGTQQTLVMGAVSSHCVSETALSAAIKGFNPTIIPDRVLSWQGDEATVVPCTSTLAWKNHGDDWRAVHTEKIKTKIETEANDPSRGYTAAERAAIGRISYAAADDVAKIPQSALTQDRKRPDSTPQFSRTQP